mgnify:CR=1 FL=1
MVCLSLRASFVVFISVVLSACGGGGQHQDLQDYIEETKRRPSGQIDPLPPFVPYESFSYGAMTLRSPFDPPVEDQIEVLLSQGKDIKPDFNREKEYLEEFNFASLSMVGTLVQGNAVWVLINDSEGGIHRVTEGNFIGKNHGRIVKAAPRQLNVIEIVPDGADGWVERPKVLQLVEKD